MLFRTRLPGEQFLLALVRERSRDGIQDALVAPIRLSLLQGTLYHGLLDKFQQFTLLFDDMVLLLDRLSQVPVLCL